MPFKFAPPSKEKAKRFCQEDRVRVALPRKNLQIKFVRPLSGGNDFVAFVDAIGKVDGRGCLLEWKTTSARYPEQPDGLLALDPQLLCYSWITGISEVRPGGIRGIRHTANSMNRNLAKHVQSLGRARQR